MEQTKKVPIQNKLVNCKKDQFNCAYYQFEKGSIIQGGVEFGPIKDYYRKIQEQGENIIIVNCAKRIGEPRVQEFEKNNNKIYWFPMNEHEQVKKCQQYLTKYGIEIINNLNIGYCIIVNCHHGMHRSVEMTKQLIELSGNSIIINK